MDETINNGIYICIDVLYWSHLYAVMLMGGETGNFLSAVVLLTLWFLVSQFLAVIVYIANEMNLLEKLVDFIKKSNKKIGKQPHIFFMVFSSLLRLFF